MTVWKAVCARASLCLVADSKAVRCWAKLALIRSAIARSMRSEIMLSTITRAAPGANLLS